MITLSLPVKLRSKHPPSTQRIPEEQSAPESTSNTVDELNTIISTIAQAIILFNNNREVIRANPAAFDLFGFDPAELNWYDLVNIAEVRYADGSPVQENELPFELSLEGQSVKGQRLILMDKQEQEHIVLASASPLFSNGQITGIITVWQDITDQERLMDQLEIEQSRLETMIENAPEGIIVADEEGRFILANPAAENLFQRPIPFGQEFQSHASLQIYYANGSPCDPRYLPLTCSALDGERMEDIELQTIQPDGQILWLLASTAPIIDRKGNLNGAVGILKDITERKRAEQMLQKQARHSSLLASLSQAFAQAGLNYPELLETIIAQVNSAMGDVCSLHILTEDGIHEYPPSTIDLPDSAHQLIVPLHAHGRTIGSMNITRLQPDNSFNRDDHVFFQELADRAAFAIEDALLFERESQQSRELQALNQAVFALLSTIELEPLLGQILDAAHNALPAAEQGILFLYNHHDNFLEARASFGCHDPQMDNQAIHTLALRATQEKKSMLLHNARIDSTWDTARQSFSSSVLVAPLIFNEDCIGVLSLFGSSANLFSRKDLSLLDSFAATATAALQNATLHNEVQRLATIDAVTGQYNRHKIIELGELEINRFHRMQIPLVAMMIDLDHFKDINDRYGHNVGDIVLYTAAERCRATIRNIDILGRYGGDEFAVLLPYASLEVAREIAERVRHAITDQPVRVEAMQIAISISLGFAQATPQTKNLSELLSQADSALYDAKQSGRNRIAMAK